MAQFYASIQGNRGEATRMGTKASGIEGHIRGWDIGVDVRCYVDTQGRDVVSVRLTGGSNGYREGKCLGNYIRNDAGEIERV